MISRRYASSSVIIEELDGLRGIAILFVVWYHCSKIFRSSLEIDPAFVKSTGALFGHGTGHGFGTDLLYQLAGTGWQGVDLFYVLSGFLITGILIDTKHRTSSLQVFYMRRFLRIVPVYFLALLILFVVLPAFTELGSRYPEAIKGQIFDWTYTKNFKLALSDLPSSQQWNRITVHFWSLAVEEQFYLLWPFLVTVLGTRAFKRMSVGIIAAHFIVRIYDAVNAGDLFANNHHDVLPYFIRYDALVAGALVAVWLRESSSDLVVRRARVMLWISLAAFATQIFFAGKVRAPVVYLIGFPVNALLGSALVALAVCGDPASRLARVLRSSILRGVGKLSYAIYVFHVLVMFGFTSTYEAMARSLPAAVALVINWSLVLAVTLVIAVTSWNLLERPLLALKRYFTVGTARAHRAGEPPLARPDDRVQLPRRLDGEA